jgi:hypothetical protein
MERSCDVESEHRVQDYQLAIRTELIYSVGLYLSLHNMQMSDCPLRHQIDPVGTRIVLKFLFLKGLGCKATHRELFSVLGHCIYSLLQTNQWIRRFRGGNLSCKKQDRSERSLLNIMDGIRRHLEKFLLISTKVLVKHSSPGCL